VILLDVYNTLALPTSTTVSVVFSLLGAALSVSLIKIGRIPGENITELTKYINSDKALAIIAGILLSVLIAFIAGTIIQFLTRLIFTFRYEKALSRFGSIWGGLCISVITYFILVKGADGASFMTPELKAWIATHTWEIFGISFAAWSLIIQILRWLFKVNIPRMIILIGTFSLAFAFAGNDLVNFIGVPLAGFKAYQAFSATPGADPSSFSMNFMTGTVKTETYLLLLSGGIMILTLWLSKKSRHVSKTELSIARQDFGEERFAATGISRTLVHSLVVINDFFSKNAPNKLKYIVNERFARPVTTSENESRSFDMIRASMNLTIASCLIALGTSMELPLSTTYVTFMVSMGTSLADRAWGRESAVYRISGVFTVIGGWFLTAVIAMLVSMVFAFLVNWGGIIAVLILFALAIFVLFRTFITHRKKEQLNVINKEEDQYDIYTLCNKNTVKVLKMIPDFLEDIIKAVYKEDRKSIKKIHENVNLLMLDTKNRKNCFTVRLRNLDEDSLEYGHFYLQMLHYIREFTHSTKYIADAAYEHIYNNHRPIQKDQYEELRDMQKQVEDIFDSVAKAVVTQDFSKKEKIKHKQEKLLDHISEFQSSQVKRIKNGKSNTRNSMLYMTLIFGMRDLLVHAIRLLKVQSKFMPNENDRIQKEAENSKQIQLKLDNPEEE
jgi:phosphate/sulfate permease